MKNKYLITFLLVVLLLGLNTTLAFGHDEDNSTTTPEFLEDEKETVDDEREPRDNRPDKIQTLQEQAKVKRDTILQKVRPNLTEDKTKLQNDIKEERLNKIKEDQAQRIKKFAEQMLRRIEAAFNRVEKLANRLLLRLDEFDEKGVDTTEPRQLLTEARELIAEGKSSLIIVGEKIDLLLASEGNFREIWQSIKEEIRKSVANVKAAHQKVVEAIRITKGSLNDNEETN